MCYKNEAVALDLGNKLWEGHQVILPEIGSLDRRQKMREYQPAELIEHEIEKTSRLISWSKAQERPSL